jgi:hypothetical protein
MGIKRPAGVKVFIFAALISIRSLSSVTLYFDINIVF